MNKPMRTIHPILKITNNSLIDLPSPINISSWWNFGSLLGLCLIIQILSGLFLAMHYTSDISTAYNSIIHICRDVNYGWLLRTIHANGASFFFYLYLYTYWTSDMLWIMYIYFNLNNWSNYIIYSNSYSIYSMCTTMSTNIILSSYCNY